MDSLRVFRMEHHYFYLSRYLKVTLKELNKFKERLSVLKWYLLEDEFNKA